MKKKQNQKKSKKESVKKVNIQEKSGVEICSSNTAVEQVCHCSHKESEHVRKIESIRPLDKKCTAKGCRCVRFVAMDPDDVEFMKEIEKNA